MKSHGDVDARVHMYTATALGRGGVVIPTLGRLYPPGKTLYSFYRRLSGPEDQPGHEGVKKISTPPDSNPVRPARNHAPYHLSYLAQF